ncbi:MAG: sulfotransferase family 2 domain-containing protein [Candidatus Riflebacteria bacterium]|nr:sulfotransferase family 2 domain-containing protein [Candidatus Riflebacteria bacterium]
MISLKERFIFVHVPKTGGTSIKMRLSGYDLKKRWQPDPKEILFLYTHFSAFHLRKALKEHDKSIQHESFLQFAFVRNPFERVLSAFMYLSNGGGGTLQDLQFALLLKPFNLLFKDFIKNGLFQLGETIPHFFPQYFWTHKGLKDKPLNFIGRYENLENDFQYILNKVRPNDTNKDTSLPWLRKTDHLHYTLFYDGETKDLVAKFYKEDIKLFNYDFE